MDKFFTPLIFFILAAIAVGIASAVIKKIFERATVFEYQRGLLYSNGKLMRTVDSGSYLLFRPIQAMSIIDIRETILNITNQEVICADNLSLRFSASVVYKVADPAKAIHLTQKYQDVLYLEAQLALRDAIAGLNVDNVLAKRGELSNAFTDRVKARAEAIGLEITSAGIRDITFPGDVKKIYSAVAQAEKAGQAAIAKARSEVASLRALANAAKMMDGNPSLLSLRTLQSISELAGTSGNSIVFGVPSPIVPVPTHGTMVAERSESEPSAQSD